IVALPPRSDRDQDSPSLSRLARMGMMDCFARSPVRLPNRRDVPQRMPGKFLSSLHDLRQGLVPCPDSIQARGWRESDSTQRTTMTVGHTDLGYLALTGWWPMSGIRGASLPACVLRSTLGCALRYDQSYM